MKLLNFYKNHKEVFIKSKCLNCSKKIMRKTGFNRNRNNYYCINCPMTYKITNYKDSNFITINLDNITIQYNDNFFYYYFANEAIIRSESHSVDPETFLHLTVIQTFAYLKELHENIDLLS